MNEAPLSSSFRQHMHPSVSEYVRSAKIADEYDQWFAGHPLFEYDCHFIDEHVRPPGRILDLGCGTGRHLAFLGSKGFTPVGLDLNPHMLGQAAANCRATGLSFRIALADFHMLPLRPEARFSGILLMFSTLGLVQKHEKRVQLLATLRAHVAEGGCLIFHVHNDNYLKVSHLWARGRERFSSLWAGSTREPGDRLMPKYRGLRNLYCHFFTRQEVHRLLAESGFRPTEIRALNARRDGPYQGDDADREANGFLIAAEPL